MKDNMIKDKSKVKFKGENFLWVVRGVTDGVAALYYPLGIRKPVMLILKGKHNGN